MSIFEVRSWLYHFFFLVNIVDFTRGYLIIREKKILSNEFKIKSWLISVQTRCLKLSQHFFYEWLLWRPIVVSTAVVLLVLCVNDILFHLLPLYIFSFFFCCSISLRFLFYEWKQKNQQTFSSSAIHNRKCVCVCVIAPRSKKWKQ